MNNHKLFLDIASLYANQSHCVSFQVGTIIVKDGRILSAGVNGTPKGYINCDDYHLNQPDYKWSSLPEKDRRELHHKWSLVHEVHSEVNACANAAANGVNLTGATAYLTISPCTDCMKLLIASGIKYIIFKEQYDKSNQDSFIMAKQCGVTLEKYNEN
jgi:dCMP deaminase